MKSVKKGDKIQVEYEGKFEDGTVFDASEKHGKPLEFKVGSGNVLKAFEEATIGMNEGEEKEITLPPKEAYGDYQNEYVMEIPIERFPSEVEPRVGQRFQVDQGDGKTFMVLVTQISDSSVTLDANHPLAGKDLIFDIELLEIAS